MNLLQMQNLLTDKLRNKASVFARIGKRYIINLNYVYRINVLRQYLILSDGVNFVYQLSISKDSLKSLKKMYVLPLMRNPAFENAAGNNMVNEG